MHITFTYITIPSSEFWSLCTEYSTSRVKTRSYFKDQQLIDARCKKLGNFTIFSKFSTVIFITISAWRQSFWIFQCNDLRKWPQMLERGSIIWNSFSKISRLFPILRKVCFLHYFRAALKRLAFNSSAITCYLMKTKNIKL